MHGQRDDIIPFYHGFRLHKAGAKGKGTVRQEHSISPYHSISIGRFWMFFWGVSKAAPLASLFPSSCRQMQRQKTSLVSFLQFPTLFPFLEVLFFNEVLLVSDQPNRLHLMFLVPGHNDLVETDMRAYFGEVVNFRIADGCSEWNSWRFWYPTFMVHKMASWHVHEPRNCQDRPLGRNESVLNIKPIERFGKTIDMVFFKRNFSQTDPCLLQDPGYFQSRTFQRWSVPRWLISFKMWEQSQRGIRCWKTKSVMMFRMFYDVLDFLAFQTPSNWL